MSCANYPGLYVHIPFCKSKCPYCDFYSITTTDQIGAFLSALDAEARLYRDQFPAFDSLFLGGGTPSWLGEAHLTGLMKNLRRHFTFATDSEITLEANPDDLTADKLALLRDLGINRLSLGVQSFDEAELRFLGRRHTARQTKAALLLIRAAGFTNLGLDLMYGLPGQTLDAWINTLKTALSFAPEHLSCYQLTVADATPLGRRVAAGQVGLPDEETQREFFLLTANFLTARGYLHYEVANFAREEKYVCRHNVKYWTRTPYLGLGPAAHSFQAGRRWWNFSSVGDYCSSLDAGQPPVAGEESLTPARIRLETLYLGFRTREGVSLGTIREQPDGNAIVAMLTQAGLVRLDHDRVIATADGLVVADRLPLWFADETGA
ncbi:MAG: radical SAM family heme chaperone HemW [Deltaproteobacteria bacterium]|nr:radical SAM family heme chaperone HemW [Deltaproteobacteria bacterium]